MFVSLKQVQDRFKMGQKWVRISTISSMKLVKMVPELKKDLSVRFWNSRKTTHPNNKNEASPNFVGRAVPNLTLFHLFDTKNAVAVSFAWLIFIDWCRAQGALLTCSQMQNLVHDDDDNWYEWIHYHRISLTLCKLLSKFIFEEK